MLDTNSATVSTAVAGTSSPLSRVGNTVHASMVDSAVGISASAEHSASPRITDDTPGNVSDSSARRSGSRTDSSVRRGSSSLMDVSRHAASCAASSVARDTLVRTTSGIDDSTVARQARSSLARPSARWAARTATTLRSSMAARRPPITILAAPSLAMSTST